MHADPASLATHRAFARRLARGLVADAQLADDVAQQSLLAALERPPRDAGAARAFLATVVRRTARRIARSEARRREREHAVARDEALPSSAELVEAMETHRRVVEAVLALRPAWRDAILLRFLEDLTPAEIARRQGTPVETVRTRIKRGLAELRARLDGGRGSERAAWLAALAPLARESGAGAGAGAPLAGATIGALVMANATKVGAALVAVLAAVWIWNGLAEEPERTQPERVPRAAQAPLAPPAPSAERAPARSALEPGGAEPTPAPPVPAAGPALRGTIRLLGPDGEALAAGDGSFRLLPVATRDEWLDVEVVAGRFAVGSLERRDFDVARLELGGAPAFFAAERHAFPADGMLELVAHRPPPARLRVVDAATGADLAGLTVLGGVARYKNRMHPGDYGPTNVLATDARSPLALDARGAEETYWVRAPGYAWGWVRVDHRGGGERVLELRREGAELLVYLPAGLDGLAAALRLYEPDRAGLASALAEVDVDAQVEHLVGLVPREVDVVLEIGDWWDPPRVLAEARVALQPGSVSELALAVDATALPLLPARLAGEVWLPRSHPQLELRHLELRPASGPPLRPGDRASLALEPIEGRSGVLAFDAGRVTPGTYRAIVSSLQWAQELVVPPEGSVDARVELPELGELLVHVVDADTGATLTEDRVTWSSSSAPSMNAWTLAHATADPETGLYRIVAPLGRAWVSADWDEHEDASRAIEVVPGERDVRLETRALPSAWLRLVDGAATVPLPWEVRVDLEPVDVDGAARRRSGRAGLTRLVADRPGTYEVTIGALPGFRPIDPFLVTFERGVTPNLTLDLERTH